MPLTEGQDIVLHCDNVSKSFPVPGKDPVHVLCDVNIKIGRGQIVGLVGPSGCGKSTLLRTIVGTHPPSGGNVVMHMRDGTVKSVRRPGRDRGMVYQKYSVFPNMTALENVAFGPLLDETSIAFRLFKYFRWRELRKKHLQEAEALLVKVGLKDALHKYPHELSGGMQQRVAVAQALIMKPEVLLMDEPFGALDEATREDLQRMLLDLYAENMHAKRAGEPPPHTIIIVTHELNEALFVGDRVIGLSQYWNWQQTGFLACPGATVVYDDDAPLHAPTDARSFEQFEAQKEEIHSVVFDQQRVRCHREFVRYWQDVHAGMTEGVNSL